MKLEFLGAAHEVTGSCFLLTAADRHILVDCGMEQGKDIYRNPDIPVTPGDIDAVLLTHAHIDHSGRIPLLVKQGYSGPVYSTDATRDLCAIMLLDSAHIQESDAEWRTRKNKRAGREAEEPLYTVDDASRAVEQFVPVPYDTEKEIFPGVVISFTDVGHLLGSASITVRVTENGRTETIVFSGDIGNVNQPIIKDPTPMNTADYVVMESTYGNRSHGPRPDYISSLTRIIQKTFARGGNVVIPCFAVGRTQEMLYMLREIKERELVAGYGNWPVYVDSPLAIQATQVVSENYSECFDDEALALINRGVNPLRFPGLRLSVTSQDSIAINEDPTPKVIISASGMCEAGRIRHHLKHNLWRGESTILFVGYQAVGTLGRTIAEGAEEVKLFGETIAVKANIEVLDGVSGHADDRGLMKWISSFNPKPKKVFVVHGEDKVTDYFAQRLTEEMSLDAAAPYPGAQYDLTEGVWLSEGSRELVGDGEKPSEGRRRQNVIFARLTAAGRRLMGIIEKNSGLGNKQMAKFADQVEALCNKWE